MIQCRDTVQTSKASSRSGPMNRQNDANVSRLRAAGPKVEALAAEGGEALQLFCGRGGMGFPRFGTCCGRRFFFPGLSRRGFGLWFLGPGRFFAELWGWRVEKQLDALLVIVEFRGRQRHVAVGILHIDQLRTGLEEQLEAFRAEYEQVAMRYGSAYTFRDACAQRRWVKRGNVLSVFGREVCGRLSKFC